MTRAGLVLTALALLTTFLPSPAAGAAAGLEIPASYLVIEGLAAMRVPSVLVTWTTTIIDEGHAKITVHDLDGAIYGALMLNEPRVPPITVITATSTLSLPESAGDEISILSNCTTTLHGYSLCADISYAGGSGAVWNMASTSGQANNYYCYNCLTIQGCYEALFTFCDREALFSVEGASSGASVCWTWGAWRDVWTKAIYDGVSVTSDRVWVTATTTC